MAAGIDINWFFYGLEKFKITVMRNVVIKFILMILIFVFVKNKNSLVLYTFLMAIAMLLSNGILWFYQRKIITNSKPTYKNMIVHLKKNIILFIPVLAISFYNVMDKIMIGGMLNVTEVGLYENAEKIINVPLNVLTAFGVAMLPHATNLLANKKEEKVIEYINKTMKLTLFMAFPIIIGIYISADKIVISYLGDEFRSSIVLVQFLTIIILFKIWANIIRTQYLIPKEKDTSYILSVIVGAILNVIFNIILIKRFGTIGAVYGTIIAELAVCIIQTASVSMELPIKQYLKYGFKYLIISLIMGCILILEKIILDKCIFNNLLYLCVLILSGIAIYVLLNLHYVKTIIKEIILNKEIKEEKL